MTNILKTYIVALAVAGAGAATLEAGAAAQAKPPNFAGVWVMVAVTPKPVEAANALKPTPVTIRQSATSIELDSTFFDQTRTMKFTIDGAKPDTNRTGAQVWTTNTRWNGAALVTTGRIAQNTSAGYEEWKYTETRTMDARGRMVVNRKQVALDGSEWTGTTEWAREKKGPRP